MLLPILWFVALMALLSGAMLEMSMMGSRIGLNRSIAAYTDMAMNRAVTNYVNQLQQDVHVGGTAHAMNSPNFRYVTDVEPLCGTRTSTGLCSLNYFVFGRLNQSSSSSTGRTPANALQKQFAFEEKVNATITVQVPGQNGDTLAERTRLLTFRIYNNAPYATLTGERDVDTSVGLVDSAQGDTAGRNVGATDYSNTAILVRMTCQQMGRPAGDTRGSPVAHSAASEHLPWGNDTNGAYEVQCVAPDQDVSNFNSPYWNGNSQRPTGWQK